MQKEKQTRGRQRTAGPPAKSAGNGPRHRLFRTRPLLAGDTHRSHRWALRPAPRPACGADAPNTGTEGAPPSTPMPGLGLPPRPRRPVPDKIKNVCLGASKFPGPQQGQCGTGWDSENIDTGIPTEAASSTHSSEPLPGHHEVWTTSPAASAPVPPGLPSVLRRGLGEPSRQRRPGVRSQDGGWNRALRLPRALPTPQSLPAVLRWVPGDTCAGFPADTPSRRTNEK